MPRCPARASRSSTAPSAAGCCAPAGRRPSPRARRPRRARLRARPAARGRMGRRPVGDPRRDRGCRRRARRHGDPARQRGGDLRADRPAAGALRERLLGRLAGVTAALAHPGALDGWFDGPCAWMRDPARAGVGGFGDLALHVVDALVALRADEPPALHAVTLDRAGVGRADVGGIALGTWAGAPLMVRASWATRPGGLGVVITGAAGTATL